MFTVEEIDNLIAACEAWEREVMTDGLMGMMIGSIVLGGNKEKHEEFHAQQKQNIEQKRGEQRVRKDKSTLLKAKLIEMRNKIIYEELQRR